MPENKDTPESNRKKDESSREEIRRKAEGLPSRPSDTDPSAAQPSHEPPSPDKPFQNLGMALGSVFFVITILVVATGSARSIQEGISHYLSSFTKNIDPSRLAGAEDENMLAEGDSTFKLVNLANHPNRAYEPYIGGPIIVGGDQLAPAPLISEFRSLIELYVNRQAVDDNFTIRVFDSRTSEVLEVYELEEARAEYERTGEADWLGAIDQLRRVETRRLVDKYVAQGIPQDPIIVKWGRANQVLLAQERNESFIEHEVRLSQFLDLSLLATQVSMVETFNHDKWVSSAGARSRFQMMPWILQQNDVTRYSLPLGGGGSVQVREEWNPLITMIPAFKLMRAYSNAVGHEIPGLSAYHTGPGNIFSVYKYYLNRASDRYVSERPTVMDAYMWATTVGYPVMRANTSFGPFSRGYVVSAYGALKAVDEEVLDTSHTMLTVRVQLQQGEQIQLSELLGVLSGRRARLTTREDMSLYEIFQWQNKHIPLPEASGSGVPTGGNVVLSATAGGDDVTFFLPLGAAGVLDEAGMDILDEEATLRFDHNVFSEEGKVITQADREYRRFVQNTSTFGFSPERKRRLDELEIRFEQLAEENPTLFRQWQFDIIQDHARIWSTDAFDELASVVQSHQGRLVLPTRSTSPLKSNLDVPPEELL